MTAVLDFLNTIFSGYVLIYGLLAVGVFFTLRLGFLQFRHFGEFFRVIRGAPSTDQAGITPFQALGVFIDTLVVCTVTALIILLSGVFEPGTGATGTELTQNALEYHVGAGGSYFVAIAILFFAFTSIVGNYSYAENALTYLGFAGKTGLTVLRSALLLMVLWGSLQSVATVFNTADASMGLMATINLVAIVLLSGTVVKLTKDYFAQRAQGQEPVFHGGDYPELADEVDQEIWYRG